MQSISKQTLKLQLVQLINVQKKINPTRILSQSFDQLGFETIDIVDIILEVEKAYHVIIPDEILLNKVDDFVKYLASQTQSTQT